MIRQGVGGGHSSSNTHVKAGVDAMHNITEFFEKCTATQLVLPGISKQGGHNDPRIS
jgi:hypothetical protein